MLQRGLVGDAETGGSSPECAVKATSLDAPQRFEHYQLMTGEDGKPVELGRGAMGITYKAFDVDLRCPVALKVSNEKHLGDETARQRFLREARAAASVRHPNVASVFHLGRTRQELLLCDGVCRGGIEEEGAVTAKIIDLGLAKVNDESGAQTTISATGAFAGTPEFASPEQIMGGEVDIRSDLYSLGVSLWQMLTGEVPFRGSALEVTAKHQHAPLPLERLEGIPQPAVTLIAVLLKKDPQKRFQAPAELLKFIPTVASAIDEGQTLTYQSLRQLPAGGPSGLAGKPGAKLGPQNISIARLPVTGSDLFGREEDIAFLDAAWANPSVNVVNIVAWTGVGKSTLINHWLRQWLPNTTTLLSSFMVGRSIGRAPAWGPRPPMNLWTRRSTGLEIQILGLERHGRRVKDWPNWSHIVGRYWFWMAWSRCKIRLAHRKGGSVNLPSRRF
jgi:serine/threonine protein kinase